jgi:hypothetical protein
LAAVVGGSLAVAVNGLSNPRDHLKAFLGVLILISLTIVRLIPTYSTFTQTYDEPNHVACGMTWLENRNYHSCVDHPPLARVAVALGLFVKGIRSRPPEGDEDAGNPILYSDGNYVRNLTLARMGNLPFLVLACVVVFLWSYRWFSAAAGVWAVLLFVNLPPILGHAGLATQDIACAATVLAALYQWMRWLEAPGWRRAIGFALALSLALLSKFSNFAFLAVCCGGTLIYVSLAERAAVFGGTKRRSWIVQGCAVAGITVFLFWAGYRFDLHPVSDARGGLSLPLTEAARGLWQLYKFNQEGEPYYLFGRTSPLGWWLFFPVAVAVKTPIAFLLLAAAGIVMVLAAFRKRPWQHRLTAFFPIAILLVCMASRINLGLRHALAIYPFLAILAGQLIAMVVLSKRRLMIFGTALLVCWVLVDAGKAHPDYMAYFNPLAGARPERILCESDLDWGQDLHRLSQRLEALGIHDVAIAYFGTARLQEAGLPRYRELGRSETATGYIAVSVRMINLEYALDGSYAWLRPLTPIERIGKSIYLFHVDE